VSKPVSAGFQSDQPAQHSSSGRKHKPKPRAVKREREDEKQDQDERASDGKNNVLVKKQHADTSGAHANGGEDAEMIRQIAQQLQQQLGGHAEMQVIGKVEIHVHLPNKN
jgi:hypothetical protein